jgi:hypothetical protein
MRLLLKWGSWILILLLLCGCTPSVQREWGPISYWYTVGGQWVKGEQYEVRIDQDFTPAERVELLKVISDWNYVLNGQIVFRVIGFMPVGELKDNKELLVPGYWFIKIDSSNKTIKELDLYYKDTNQKVQALAYVNEIGGNLLYFNMERIGLDRLRGVGYHEMGHILGAVHHPGGLMDSVATPAHLICIDEDTVHQVVKYLQLDWERVNWCYFGQTINKDQKPYAIPSHKGK